MPLTGTLDRGPIRSPSVTSLLGPASNPEAKTFCFNLLVYLNFISLHVTRATCLVGDEGGEHLQRAVRVVEASHRFGPLKQQDVGNGHRPKPGGETGSETQPGQKFKRWKLETQVMVPYLIITIVSISALREKALQIIDLRLMLY